MIRHILIIVSLFFFFSCSTNAKNSITLTPENTIVFRGEVNQTTASQFQKDLIAISDKLNPEEIIYLVLDSPGGSVYDGVTILNSFPLVPQKIHTITIFAASMAFMISQEGEKRFIIDNGIIMGHRAKGGFEGQFAIGEVESQLKLWTELVEKLESKVADRMSLSLKEYKNKIKDEMWLFDKNAVKEKAADEVITLKCSKELIKKEVVRTMYRQELFFAIPVEVVFSGCPLIKTPLRVLEKGNKK